MTPLGLWFAIGSEIILIHYVSYYFYSNKVLITSITTITTTIAVVFYFIHFDSLFVVAAGDAMRNST